MAVSYTYLFARSLKFEWRVWPATMDCHLSSLSSTVQLCWIALTLLSVVVPSGLAHYNQPQYGVPPPQQGYQHPVPQQGYAGQPQQYQASNQEVPHYQQVPQAGSNVLHDTSRIHDKEHIKEHLHEAVGDQDVNKMSEEELQFHYFKMHDNDNNNKLDGSELIKSLIHWHVEEMSASGGQGTTKVFTDTELEQMIDPILSMDDKNNDGFIDYPEFIAAQKTRGF